MTETMQGADHNAGRTAYTPVAIYHSDSDCVEYVKEDALAVYDRVDEFLTLIYDETGISLIGFKLKGFNHIFETQLKQIYKLHDMQFVDLVNAIETVFTSIGNKIFETGDEGRVAAYKAAIKLAQNDNVRLSAAYLKAA